MSDDYSKLYGGTAVQPEEDEPEIAPKPFTLDSSSVDMPLPPPPNPPRPVYTYTPPPQAQQTYVPPQGYAPRPVPPPAPVKEKKPFSPIPLLLIAGVAFFFLGGIIFLTSTWDVMSNTKRAVTLLSAGVIAFAANILAERVFKLQKTGLAFYILGCIFLPLSIGGIGVFSLFGEWFSFDGKGRMLVCAAIALSIGASTLVGEKRYRSTFLAWVSQVGFAGTLSFIAAFIRDDCAELKLSENTGMVICCSLWVLFAIGATVWTEFLKRKCPDSLMGKTVVGGVLYPLLVLYAFMMWTLMDGVPVAAAILSVLIALLFCNMRFAAGQIHIGAIGSGFALITACCAAVRILGDEIINGYSGWFILAATSAVLMAARIVKRPALAKTYSLAGLIIGIAIIPLGVCGTWFENKQVAWLLTTYTLLLMSTLFVAFAKKNKFPVEVLYMGVQISLVFLTLLLNTDEFHAPLLLLLVLTALLLLVEAFLGKHIWALMTAGAACAGIIIERLPVMMTHRDIVPCCILWLFAIGFLVSVIYAHAAGRRLLEKSTAWMFLALLVSGTGITLQQLLGQTMPVLVLVTALITLLYLLEAVVFWKHARTDGTKLYLEILSVIGCFAAMIALLVTSETAFGWGGLLLLLISVFAVVFLRMRINAASLLHLLMLFVTAAQMLGALSEEFLAGLGMSHPAVWSVVFRIAGYAVLLGLFAVMGRVLVPEGFVSAKEREFRMDWPLLVGILPVFGAALTVDWHPGILIFLFLALYSLLYIGRLHHKRIPALLASLFFCMTILLHNWEDPFGLFVLWRDWEVRTPQLLLYLLPLHLYIFTLVWILPKFCRSGVHLARFVMYCLTMLCLLLSSMSFGNVADAIVLVVFSFLILAGSFFVKRLRWFALGFAVLVLMTVRLTWSFWTSLHWGIYLFLAGALLIGIASVYELKVRRASDTPDAPKKSMNPFSAWKW